jgi:hypothetical protein
MQFARETVEEISADMGPLILLHAKEVGDREATPDLERYFEFERLGILRIFTVRSEARLRGYALYLIGPSLNYRELTMAQQTLIFVHPQSRGPMAVQFMRFTEQQLALEGVQEISQSSNARRPIGHWLEHLGYTLKESIYVKAI